jgi:predicted RNA methylase
VSVKSAKAPIEYGDFQTPQGLADNVCETLITRGVRPASVLEPTCGVGAFLVSSLAAFPQADQLQGLDISAKHTEALRKRLTCLERGERVTVRESDFFSLEWRESASELAEPLLVIGNPPWVTNAVIGSNSGVLFIVYFLG